MRALLLCLALVGMPALPGQAEEGFFAKHRPPAVRKAWGSVFAFVCSGRRDAYTASAFLVKKIDKDRPGTRRRMMADYYFVTAGHAISACEGRHRALVENLDQPEFEDDGITVARRPARLRYAKTVYVDDAYDIAIVKARAAADARIGAPIPVEGTCERALDRTVYSIGFPGVAKRRSLRLKGETKRWSKGTYVGLGIADFRGVDATYIAATVDSLPGSSGGPVVDETGSLVGVVAKGAAGEDNGYRYDVDPSDPRDWQTFLVPCQAVERILKKSWRE